MPKKIFVGQLPRSLTSAELESLFSSHGVVRSAEVIMDRFTGQSRGFAFVQMETQQATQEAMKNLHGSQVQGHTLVVKEAQERTPAGRNPRGGTGGRGRIHRG